MDGTGAQKQIIGNLAQGSAYSMCIPITTLQSKGVADEISVYPRHSNGCCRRFTAPGIMRRSQIYGGQIVCGTVAATGGLASSLGDTVGNSGCNYNACYVMKQNIPCASGPRQFLNGCCGTSGAPTFTSTCVGTFYSSQRSSYNEIVESCTSKLKEGVTTYAGTLTGADDQVDGALVTTAVYAATACTGSEVLGDTKVSSSYQIRNFVAIIFSLAFVF